MVARGAVKTIKVGDGGARGVGGSGNDSSNRRARPSKPSARYRRILEDEAYEAQIQKSYAAPSGDLTAARRELPLHVQRQRDGAAFTLPSLGSLCLRVAARHFLTHVLPSRETFDAVAGTSKRDTDGRVRKRPRIVSRGIGGRPILDEESAAGRDWLPETDGEDGKPTSASARGSQSAVSRTSDVGIAATPRSMRSQGSSPPGESVAKLKVEKVSTAELTVMARENHDILKTLPDHTSIKLLALLRTACPHALTRHVLTTYFVAGRTEVELDAGMTLLADRPQDANLIIKSASTTFTTHRTSEGDAAATLSRSPHISRPLRRLCLSGLTRLDPAALSGLFRRCHSLEEVVLKGCVRVDAECMSALVHSGNNASTLRVLNVNFTEVGLNGVESIVSRCPNLRVLKVANLTGLTDRTIPEMLRRCTDAAASSSTPFLPLSRLETLKLRATDLGPVGISSFLQLCTRTLRNLDLAGLNLLTTQGITTLAAVLGIELGPVGGHASAETVPAFPKRAANPPALRKLNLSDNVPSQSRPRDVEAALPLLMRLVANFSASLEVLLLDNLGLEWRDFQVLQRGMAEHLPPSDQTMPSRDGTFPQLPLRRMSLNGSLPTILEVQDFRTGSRDAPPTHDISLKASVTDLSLSGIDLRTNVFYKMYVPIPYDNEATDAASSPRSWAGVQRLDLSHTQISDVELAAFASRLTAGAGTGTDEATGSTPALSRQRSSLREINLAGTSVSAEGVKALLRMCPYAERVDLTGCRGVGVRERRGIFESLAGECHSDTEADSEGGGVGGGNGSRRADNAKPSRRSGKRSDDSGLQEHTKPSPRSRKTRS